jgi:hypothetical protein
MDTNRRDPFATFFAQAKFGVATFTLPNPTITIFTLGRKNVGQFSLILMGFEFGLSFI